MDIEIRPYCDADQDEWMLVHARIMTLSQSWNYCIQERPTYAGNESTCLVACHEGKIIAITDTIYDNEPGEICLIKDRRGGYVTEFGRLPEYAGCSLGKRMMYATMDAAKSKGVTRLEYWSQDPGAHIFYEKIGMHEIGRHFRFRMEAPKEIVEYMLQDGIGIEYIYGVCQMEDWEHVQKKHALKSDHPLEPKICVGYSIEDFKNPFMVE